MSNDLQKYENWRAITESDYVTMFIKTWFAFIATLREMYPKENLNDIIGKGDTVFINPFLANFETHYLEYNDFEKVKDNILKVYSLGRKYVLENQKFNRFFVEDFYYLNKKFKYQKEADDYDCSVRYAGDCILVIHVLFKNKNYYQEKKPLIIKSRVDFSDLIKRQFRDNEIEKYLDDESVYLYQFVEWLKNRVVSSYIAAFIAGKYNEKFSKKDFNVLNALNTQEINRVLQSGITAMLDDSTPKSELLYFQMPCANFKYKLSDNQSVPIIDTYKWFLKFIYFLRNALFHEIIDPLENFWQDMFKNAYLALKEILDGNIKFLQEQDKVKETIYYSAWEEMRNKPKVYIPNFNEHYDNGDLEIEMISYLINGESCEIKANISLDYWADPYTVKRITSSYSAKIKRGQYLIESFKMKKTDETIVKQIGGDINNYVHKQNIN